jgi:hypothetical protein
MSGFLPGRGTSPWLLSRSGTLHCSSHSGRADALDSLLSGLPPPSGRAQDPLTLKGASQPRLDGYQKNSGAESPSERPDVPRCRSVFALVGFPSNFILSLVTHFLATVCEASAKSCSAAANHCPTLPHGPGKPSKAPHRTVPYQELCNWRRAATKKLTVRKIEHVMPSGDRLQTNPSGFALRVQ